MDEADLRKQPLLFSQNSSIRPKKLFARVIFFHSNLAAGKVFLKQQVNEKTKKQTNKQKMRVKTRKEKIHKCSDLF